VSLPSPGDVFAFAVSAPDGVEVLLRVVDAQAGACCVVMTRACAPLKKTRALFEVQPLAHHAWNRPVLGAWVTGGPPPTVKRVGAVPLRAGEAERVLHPERWVKQVVKTKADAQRVVSLASWDVLLRDVRLQWRWDHERAAVLAEDAARQRQQESALVAALAAQGRQRETLSRRGVAALARRRFFGAWKGSAPRALISEAEALLRDAVTALVGKTPAQATRRLTQVVKRFNALDGAHGHTFDTIDREDISDALGTVALACGVDDETFEEVLAFLE
jgi:hypothetical protein